MQGQIELHTDRLLLKSITPAIVSELFEQKNEAELKQYFNHDEAGYEHLKSMHDDGMKMFRISTFYFLLIYKETQKVIGECGFHTWNSVHARAEIFYSLRNDSYKRQGFMTEALEKVIDFGFKELKLHRIAGLIAKENIASLKLLERYGFKKEGTLREDYLVGELYEDSECYSLLKNEWNNGSI